LDDISSPNLHGKNDFAEGSKILLDLKIILLDHQNNFAGILKIMSNAAKNFGILATNLNVLHNYFDNYFKSFNKTIFFFYARFWEIMKRNFAQNKNSG